ncbi:hypothetical protein [Paenibacillus aceris]|uniref:Flagellar protein FliT n=1 Tax=Paenibacillus aceris TaxID=869555 RepID=A0ABS4I4G4_9BACL|nr:hypothetical protein [Paenibacillus aceris]MBP1965807.1 hypothetical protein [Paenibacillus aceris]NHW34847.1 hypothetical protein [Paenibacillus aceris]
MITILKSIQGIYQEILSENHIDAYFSREARLNGYFEQLYAFGPVTRENAESSLLIREVHNLNQQVTVLIQESQKKLKQSQRAKDYIQRFVEDSVFIDRKG